MSSGRYDLQNRRSQIFGTDTSDTPRGTFRRLPDVQRTHSLELNDRHNPPALEDSLVNYISGDIKIDYSVEPSENKDDNKNKLSSLSFQGRTDPEWDRFEQEASKSIVLENESASSPKSSKTLKRSNSGKKRSKSDTSDKQKRHSGLFSYLSRTLRKGKDKNKVKTKSNEESDKKENSSSDDEMEDIQDNKSDRHTDEVEDKEQNDSGSLPFISSLIQTIASDELFNKEEGSTCETLSEISSSSSSDDQKTFQGEEEENTNSDKDRLYKSIYSHEENDSGNIYEPFDECRVFTPVDEDNQNNIQVPEIHSSNEDTTMLTDETSSPVAKSDSSNLNTPKTFKLEATVVLDNGDDVTKDTLAFFGPVYLSPIKDKDGQGVQYVIRPGSSSGLRSPTLSEEDMIPGGHHMDALMRYSEENETTTDPTGCTDGKHSDVTGGGADSTPVTEPFLPVTSVCHVLHGQLEPAPVQPEDDDRFTTNNTAPENNNKNSEDQALEISPSVDNEEGGRETDNPDIETSNGGNDEEDSNGTTLRPVPAKRSAQPNTLISQENEIVRESENERNVTSSDTSSSSSSSSSSESDNDEKINDNDSIDDSKCYQDENRDLKEVDASPSGEGISVTIVPKRRQVEYLDPSKFLVRTPNSENKILDLEKVLEIPISDASVVQSEKSVIVEDTIESSACENIVLESANIVSIEADIVPIQANIVSNEANIVPIEANIVPNEANTVPIEANIVSNQANIVSIDDEIVLDSGNNVPEYDSNFLETDDQRDVKDLSASDKGDRESPYEAVNINETEYMEKLEREIFPSKNNDIEDKKSDEAEIGTCDSSRSSSENGQNRKQKKSNSSSDSQRKNRDSKGSLLNISAYSSSSSSDTSSDEETKDRVRNTSEKTPDTMELNGHVELKLNVESESITNISAVSKIISGENGTLHIDTDQKYLEQSIEADIPSIGEHEVHGTIEHDSNKRDLIKEQISPNVVDTNVAMNIISDVKPVEDELKLTLDEVKAPETVCIHSTFEEESQLLENQEDSINVEFSKTKPQVEECFDIKVSDANEEKAESISGSDLQLELMEVVKEEATKLEQEQEQTIHSLAETHTSTDTSTSSSSSSHLQKDEEPETKENPQSDENIDICVCKPDQETQCVNDSWEAVHEALKETAATIESKECIANYEQPNNDSTVSPPADTIVSATESQKMFSSESTQTPKNDMILEESVKPMSPPATTNKTIPLKKSTSNDQFEADVERDKSQLSSHNESIVSNKSELETSTADTNVTDQSIDDDVSSKSRSSSHDSVIKPALSSYQTKDDITKESPTERKKKSKGSKSDVSDPDKTKPKETEKAKKSKGTSSSSTSTSSSNESGRSKTSSKLSKLLRTFRRGKSKEYDVEMTQKQYTEEINRENESPGSDPRTSTPRSEASFSNHSHLSTSELEKSFEEMSTTVSSSQSTPSISSRSKLSKTDKSFQSVSSNDTQSPSGLQAPSNESTPKASRASSLDSSLNLTQSKDLHTEASTEDLSDVDRKEVTSKSESDSTINASSNDKHRHRSKDVERNQKKSKSSDKNRDGSSVISVSSFTTQSDLDTSVASDAHSQNKKEKEKEKKKEKHERVEKRDKKPKDRPERESERKKERKAKTKEKDSKKEPHHVNDTTGSLRSLSSIDSRASEKGRDSGSKHEKRRKSDKDDSKDKARLKEETAKKPQRKEKEKSKKNKDSAPNEQKEEKRRKDKKTPESIVQKDTEKLPEESFTSSKSSHPEGHSSSFSSHTLSAADDISISPSEIKRRHSDEERERKFSLQEVPFQPIDVEKVQEETIVPVEAAIEKSTFVSQSATTSATTKPDDCDDITPVRPPRTPKSKKSSKMKKILPSLRSPRDKEKSFEKKQTAERKNSEFDGTYHREDDGIFDEPQQSDVKVTKPKRSPSKREDVPYIDDVEVVDVNDPALSPEPRHFVVVAIDFGTTHSGYAFSFTRHPSSIYMMRVWAGEEPGVTNHKTLTSLLLDSEGQFHSFGYNARSNYLNLIPLEARHWLYFSTFKMELHNNSELNRDTLLVAANGVRFPALRVFALSLQFFKDHALQQLSDQSGTEILNEDIRWVITVPAIWKAPAKQFMRQAAYDAGLASSNYPGQLIIALEPEAASIYCRRLRMYQLVPDQPIKKPLQPPSRASVELINQEPAVTELFVGKSESTSDVSVEVKPDAMLESQLQGSRYLVVDCGGGTVDITVHELDPSGYLKEIHRATGGPYGAVGIDVEFEKLLCGLFGVEFVEHYKRRYPMGWVHLMTDFESRKRSASPHKNTSLNISPPFTFLNDFKKHKCDPEVAVKKYGDPAIEWSPQGMLRLSPVAMRRLFLPTVTRIKQEVGDVINHPNARDLKYFFLVGGFAESPMLQHELRQEFQSIMKPLIPIETSLAVLKGAVMFGIDPSLVRVRKSRLTYGVGILNRFDASRHPESKRVRRDGVDWCTDVFDKYVETDQPVMLWNSVIRSYTPAKPDQVSIVLNIYSSHNPNIRFITDPGVTRCGTLCLTLPDVQDTPPGGRSSPREIRTRMSFGDTEINVMAVDLVSGRLVKASVDFLGR